MDETGSMDEARPAQPPTAQPEMAEPGTPPGAAGALSRIRAALERIEHACDQLRADHATASARHAALRRNVEGTLDELDTLIARTAADGDTTLGAGDE